MTKINVTDEFVSELLESRGWAKAGITPVINEEVTEQEDAQEDAQESEVIEEADSKEQEPQAHVCPLCESQLEGELSDEALEEHAGAMLGVFTEAGLISEEMEVGEDFIIENATAILDILSEAGLIVEEDEE